MLKLIALIFVTFVSCSKPTVDEKALPNDKISALKKRYEEKYQEAKEKFDKKTGWPSARDCDGTLWAGLAKASRADFVRLELAEYDAGEIHRRPESSGECYPGESASTVSRDMLLGYLFGAWRTGEKNSVRRLRSYGEAHAWIMGRPAERIGEVLLTGNMIGLLGRMSCKMEVGCPVYSKIPPLYTKASQDYVKHLTVLFILLQGEVHDGVVVSYDPTVSQDYPGEVVTTDITKDEKKILEQLHEEDPSDALMSAAYHLYDDGVFDEAIDLLLGDYVYPTYVRAEHVDETENYRRVHWLFTAELILRRYR